MSIPSPIFCWRRPTDAINRGSAENHQIGRCPLVGADSRVWPCGSRADDARRGGDIDLLVETPHAIPGRVGALCRLEGALVMGLGERKIDVVLKDARTAEAPGVLL